MKLSDWFTIITILLAVLAFFSQVERKILWLKINSILICITGVILFLVIPVLLYYQKLAFPQLDNQQLFTPENWAFILFFILVVFWIWWFLTCLKKVEPTGKLVNHYLRSINTMAFEDLFRLFIKYEETQLENVKNFRIYAPLLTDERFFNAAIDFNPNIYLKIIQNLDATSLLDSQLPVIIRDKVNAVAAEQKRLGTLSAYNYEPIYHHNWPNENLLLFYLTNCYFSIMQKCIKENLFHSEISGFDILNSFMESMFSEILKSVQIPEGLNINSEGPTYFHKLLSNILLAFREWIILADSQLTEPFIKELFTKLYTSCIVKLIKYPNKIISNYYLKLSFNSLMRIYFEKPTHYKRIEDIRNGIEKVFVDSIPYEHSLKNYYRERFIFCWEYSDEDLWLHSNPIEKERFITNVLEKINNN